MTPSIACPILPDFAPDDWDDIERAFANSPMCELHQAWRADPQAAFLPAEARFGWRGGTLYLYAFLNDRDIFNAATEPNEKTWLTGDVLELFLRPAGGKAYYEVHVTPENRQLQLRFADAADFRAGGDFARFLIQQSLLQSWTEINTSQNYWRALLALDLRQLSPEHRVTVGDLWAFSVSRYDYTRGTQKPVISSTSEHAKSDFHCQKEWGELVFVES